MFSRLKICNSNSKTNPQSNIGLISSPFLILYGKLCQLSHLITLFEERNGSVSAHASQTCPVASLYSSQCYTRARNFTQFVCIRAHEAYSMQWAAHPKQSLRQIAAWKVRRPHTWRQPHCWPPCIAHVVQPKTHWAKRGSKKRLYFIWEVFSATKLMHTKVR